MPTINPVPAGSRGVLAPLLAAYAIEMAGHLAGEMPARGASIAAMLDADPRTHVLVAWDDAMPVCFAILFELPEAVFARRWTTCSSRPAGAARATRWR